MLDTLQAIYSELPRLLSEHDMWSSLVINRRLPETIRAYRYIGDLRICIHRFSECVPEEAFLHPHPWPAAFKILNGSYKMSLAHSTDRFSEPTDIDAELVLERYTEYSMTSPLTWHRIAPISETWTLMVNGKPWDSSIAHTAVRTTAGKDLGQLTPEDLKAFLQKASSLV